MIFFYFFAAILTWLGVVSLRGGFRFFDYVKQEVGKPLADFQPFATIFAPCRGLDEGLRENLTALFVQNYPAYEIIFAVDDESDKAFAVIEDLRRQFADRVSSKIVVAGKAIHCGQKVHNLRRAVLQTSAESLVFAFVDSDARPNKEWLRNLIAPLANPNIGATTGYRWFISKNRNFASELRSTWNASIASALGENGAKNFCWGGATAIRRATFDQIEMSERWRGTISDDFALMRALQTEKLPIHFQPQCLTASIEDCTIKECVEFTTRQMKITRVYAPHFWKASLIGSFLFTFVFWTGVFLVIIRACYGLSFWLPLLFVSLIFALGAAKSYIRLEAVKIALPDRRRELNQSSLAQTTLWTLAPTLFFYNNLRAAASRKITWRGIEYDLKSPTETVIIKRFEN